MERAELLRRIDRSLSRLGLSARAACLKAGLSEKYIRDLRRLPNSHPEADNLVKLARVLGEAPAYLIDSQAAIVDPLRGALDPDLLRLSMRTAENALRDEPVENRAELAADIAAAVYDLFRERQARGDDIDEAYAATLVNDLLRRLIRTRFGSKKA